eukprot:2422120-Pleurochrysis_carterae.AAC.1
MGCCLQKNIEDRGDKQHQWVCQVVVDSVPALRCNNPSESIIKHPRIVWKRHQNKLNKVQPKTIKCRPRP